MATLKKIDMFISNLSTKDLKCPICASQLNLVNKSLVCTKRHTYDINKKGYVKLLKIQKPYDDKLYTKDLFISRRNVIEQGFYDFLHDKIAKIIKKYNFKSLTILDLGCGEGSHSYNIAKTFNFKSYFLTDINKNAIELSTDYIQNGFTPILCDAYNLPFSKSIDVVIDILSPFNYRQIYDILNDEGIIIKVIPTRNYLKEIRQVNGLQEYQNEEIVYENFKSHFNIIDEELIEKTYEISPDIANEFLNMTPLTERLNQKNTMNKITISLRVIVGAKL